MNKLTDAEIVKALECCIDCKCKDCPCYKNIDGEMRCTEIYEEEILDLINRQKAEIERLTNSLSTFKSCYESLTDMYENAKSEAIKEFAERFEYFVLHENIEMVIPKFKDYESYVNGANQFRYQVKNGIKNLVKEMAGE